MNTIKITKEQLEKLLNTSNPIIMFNTYIHNGDIIECNENNSRYIIIDINEIGNMSYELKDFVNIKTEYIDLYDWEKQKDRYFTDAIKFFKLLKLEQILSSKNIDLNLLEHK